MVTISKQSFSFCSVERDAYPRSDDLVLAGISRYARDAHTRSKNELRVIADAIKIPGRTGPIGQDRVVYRRLQPLGSQSHRENQADMTPKRASSGFRQ